MNINKILCLAISIGCGFGAQLLYADVTNIEYKIKAGYLYNFTKFVTWPEDNTLTFNICILGEDPFDGLIDPIEHHYALGKPIKLFRINQLNDKQRCHVLYMNKTVSESFSNESNPVIQQIENTLVVGEGDLYATKVGMISFINRQGKIKLKINLQKMQQSSLHISAKLLEVAELVMREIDDQ